MSRRSALLFAILFPLALLGGPGATSCFHRHLSISARAELVDVLGPCRFLEGRFTGGFSYARFDPVHPGLRLSKDRRIALRKLSQKVSGSTPEAVADRALFKLLDGDPRQAVRSLEAASAAKPDSAALLSDLAAAYLADARINNDPYSRVKSLEAAENAVTIDPNLPEARFNRALALESLFLRNQARTAWDGYLKLDKKSGWAQEAKARKTASDGPDAASRWALQVQKLEAAVSRSDQQTVNQIVGQYPQASREYAEETLFGDWAAAELAKRTDEARNKLAIARAIGAALAQSNGERMVVAATEKIDREMSSRGSIYISLVNGHLSYREGLRSYAGGRFAVARDHFARARLLLSRAESPFAHWATFRLAVCEMQSFNYHRSLALLSSLDRIGFRSLEGRTCWVMGLIHGIQAQPAEAVSAYRLAQQEFAVIGESENLTVVRSLLAECLSDWGGISEAWDLHLHALRSVNELRDSIRRQQVLEQAGAAALQGENPAAALDFSREALGRSSPDSGAAAFYCLRWRALAHSRLKMWEEAKKDLREARLVATQYPDESARKSLLGDLLAIEGKVWEEENPAVSFDKLNPAIKAYEKTGYPQPLALLYAARGHAYLALGKVAEAEIDFQRAIDNIQAQQGRIAEPVQRATYLDDLRSIFEDMISLQVKLNRKELALDFWEGARAQVLREIMAASQGDENSAYLKSGDIQRDLPEDVAIVEYIVLPHELLAWVIRKKSIELFRNKISSEELRAMVKSLRRAILNKSESRGVIDPRKLSENLFEILGNSVRGVKKLIFIPDRVLYEVPFQILRQPISGRLLIEDYALSIAPSSGIYLQALRRERSRSPRFPLRASIIGDPALDHALLPMLTRLPYARSEAMSVAALYPWSRLTLGKQATLQAVLAGLSQFEIVHFSGHAVSSVRAPLLSFLALAPTANDPGLLYARDIYKLPNTTARVVVLSACSSLAGIGEGSGEGLMSVVQSFLASGVPATLGSIWEVDDQEAQELLVAFHRNLILGVGAAEALRRAQVQASKRGKVSSWAGFQLIGAGSQP